MQTPRGMSLTEALLLVAGTYCQAERCELSTLSTWALNDGQSLPRVRDGGSLTVKNWERAMLWLSANWPDPAPKGCAWPFQVPRHDPEDAREILRRRELEREAERAAAVTDHVSAKRDGKPESKPAGRLRKRAA